MLVAHPRWANALAQLLFSPLGISSCYGDAAGRHSFGQHCHRIIGWMTNLMKNAQICCAFIQ